MSFKSFDDIQIHCKRQSAWWQCFEVDYGKLTDDILKSVKKKKKHKRMFYFFCYIYNSHFYSFIHVFLSLDVFYAYYVFI